MTSAARGIIGTVMARMRLGIVLPRIATSASARMISGNDRKMSITRCRKRSTRPPKYALATPSTDPSVAPRTEAPKPTRSAVREP